MNIRPAIAVAAIVTAATLFTGCGTFGSEPSAPRASAKATSAPAASSAPATTPAKQSPTPTTAPQATSPSASPSPAGQTPAPTTAPETPSSSTQTATKTDTQAAKKSTPKKNQKATSKKQQTTTKAADKKSGSVVLSGVAVDGFRIGKAKQEQVVAALTAKLGKPTRKTHFVCDTPHVGSTNVYFWKGFKVEFDDKSLVLRQWGVSKSAGVPKGVRLHGGATLFPTPANIKQWHPKAKLVNAHPDRGVWEMTPGKLGYTYTWETSGPAPKANTPAGWVSSANDRGEC